MYGSFFKKGRKTVNWISPELTPFQPFFLKKKILPGYFDFFYLFADVQTVSQSISHQKLFAFQYATY